MLQLPAGARVCRDTDAEWTTAEHLLARISDQINPEPETRLPRPGDRRRAELEAQRRIQRGRRHEQQRRQRAAALARANADLTNN